MDPLFPLYVIGGIFAFIVFISLLRSIRIVPARSALIVERLGKYSRTLDAGIHLLLPFFDRVAYRNSLKEVALDVPDQTCFTEDNVKIKIGGVLYYMVTDPKKASYGINNFKYGIIQLAQTTMRSVIGLLELDKTFAEREHINGKIVQVLDEATEEWGVKVTRYEISIEKVAMALQVEGGEEAVSLQVTERLLAEIASLANKHTKIILPLDLTDLGSVTKLARQALSVPTGLSVGRPAATGSGLPAKNASGSGDIAKA